ncbi:MAG: InlB B-repeat-containing protein [Clostridium sp.]|nr:MAG: InlB B-repeat-containing protein [Clostridium sp.]
MKKKLLISLLALSGVAALASCGENDKPNSTTSSGSAMSIESSKSTPSKSSESSKSTPSSTPAPAPSSSSSPSSAPTPSTSSTPSTPTPSTSATPSTPSETTSSSVEVKAKVTFDVDGEKNEVQVDKGNTVTKPSDPVKEGYVFVGWFNGEEEFDFSTPILTDEVNLVAKFRELTNR